MSGRTDQQKRRVALPKAHRKPSVCAPGHCGGDLSKHPSHHLTPYRLSALCLQGTDSSAWHGGPVIGSPPPSPASAPDATLPWLPAIHSLFGTSPSRTLLWPAAVLVACGLPLSWWHSDMASPPAPQLSRVPPACQLTLTSHFCRCVPAFLIGR